MNSNYKDIIEVMDDYFEGNIDRMTAIEILQNEFGLPSLDAEKRVDSWEED